MTNSQLETKLRNQFLTLINKAIETNLETDVLPVSASELTIPCLDEEGNERWILIKVSVPRGARDGQGGYIPYDGYSIAKVYAKECEEKTEKKAKAEANKQKKIEHDQKVRAEKAALAEANKSLKELRKIKLDEATP